MKLKKFIGILMASVISMSSLSLYALSTEEITAIKTELGIENVTSNENEPYTVIQYNEGTLEDVFVKLGYLNENNPQFPKKVKIEGSKALTLEDLKLLSYWSTYLDLTDAKIENDILPEESFDYSMNLIEIKLPKTLKEIGAGAFIFSVSLQKIVLPETLTSIKEGAFNFCLSLMEINLPESLKEIGDAAFGFCPSLVELKLPNHLEKLGVMAFSGTSIDKIIFPKSIKEVPRLVFSLEMLPENTKREVGYFNSNYSYMNRILEEVSNPSIVFKPALDIVKVNDVMIEIPYGAEIKEEMNLFTKIYDSEGDSYQVPLTLNLTKVDTLQSNTVILNEAIELKDYVLDDSVKIEIKILPAPTQKGDIKSVEPLNQTLELGDPYNLPLRVETILDNGEKVMIPVRWDKSDFDRTKEGQYTLKGEVLLYEGLTNNNQLEATLNVTVQDSSKVHKSVAEDFEIDENGKLVAYLGNSKYVEIPEGVTTIGEKVFRNQHQLEKVVFPSTLKTIEGAAFRNATNLKEVVFNDGLENIGHGAFEKCKSLQSVDLPSSLNTIGISSFASCSSLTSVDLGGTIKKIPTKAFSECLSLKTVTGMNSVETIEAQSFVMCKKLKDIDLSQVVSIEREAFMKTSLEKIKFDKLNTLGEFAFAFNDKTTSLDFGNSPITVIPKHSFYNNILLSQIQLSMGLLEIEEEAFALLIDPDDFETEIKEGKIVEVNLPKSFKRLGHDVFDNKDVLKLVINSPCEIIDTSLYGIDELEINAAFEIKNSNWEKVNHKLYIHPDKVTVNADLKTLDVNLSAKEVTFGDNVTFIDLRLFEDVSEFNISDSVNSIIPSYSMGKTVFNMNPESYAYEFLSKTYRLE